VNHWIILPVVLPAMMAPFIVLAAQHDIVLQRCFSAVAVGALLLIAIGLWLIAAEGTPLAYELGAWPAPFGIVLVLDRLSALMVLLTAILAALVLAYAASGWDQRGRHFHSLFQFQLMGVNGAFLTGDVFNLFVFFEVLLIASYGLVLHGAGAPRLKAGMQYVVVNLVGSTLFLFAVGLLYAVTGTLNMADLALKVPAVAPADQAMLRTAALLLLAVFAIKAAAVPLHFWLPGTYAAAAPPVAALFMIMTKVGGYAILRIYTLVFGADAGAAAWIAAPWLLPAALVTTVLGMVGVFAARTLRSLVCFAVIGSMGTLLIAIGLFTEQAIAASLYYLVHSTIAGAALFLLVDLIRERRGAMADTLETAPAFPQAGLISGLFFLAALMIVGMPPLSGFIGKLLILDGARAAPLANWVWAVILGTSLLAMAAFGRAGSMLFWKSAAKPVAPCDAPAGPPEEAAGGTRPTYPVLPIVAVSGLLAVGLLLTALAGPVMREFELTAGQLFDRTAYVAAVLKPQAPPP
jgi:multicomponent K+:H+ antiporter subunit D